MKHGLCKLLLKRTLERDCMYHMFQGRLYGDLWQDIAQTKYDYAIMLDMYLKLKLK